MRTMHARDADRPRVFRTTKFEENPMKKTFVAVAALSALSTVSAMAQAQPGAPAQGGQTVQPGQSPGVGGCSCSCCRNMAMMRNAPAQQGAAPAMPGMEHGAPSTR